MSHRNHKKDDVTYWNRRMRAAVKQVLNSGKQPNPERHRHDANWDRGYTKSYSTYGVDWYLDEEEM